MDGLQCEVYVHAELWPSPGIEQTERPLSLVKIAWQELPAPGGFRTEVTGSVLRCRPRSGAEVELAGNAENSEQIYGVHWVSASPPRLLVAYGVSGFADMLPSTWSLYEACGPTAIAKGTRVEPGSHGLWAGEEADPDGSSRAVIWRGGTRIGALPRGDGFRFRPAPGAP